MIGVEITGITGLRARLSASGRPLNGRAEDSSGQAEAVPVRPRTRCKLRRGRDKRARNTIAAGLACRWPAACAPPRVQSPVIRRLKRCRDTSPSHQPGVASLGNGFVTRVAHGDTAAAISPDRRTETTTASYARSQKLFGRRPKRNESGEERCIAPGRPQAAQLRERRSRPNGMRAFAGGRRTPFIQTDDADT